MLANFLVIGTLAFINVAQSYLLTQHLNVPADAQGRISGDLAFWNELVVIALAAPFGIMADRIGRRPIIVLGMVLVGAGFLICGLAETLTQFTIGRLVFACGAAAGSGMIATIGADYPQEVSRGKMVGFGAILNALGIVTLTALFGRLPNVLVQGGTDPVLAGTIVMSLVAGLALLAAIAFQLGLRGGVPGVAGPKLPFTTLFRDGLAAARNPRIALAYASAFTSRGDLAVVGVFVSLWAVRAGVDSGLSPAEALAKGTVTFVVSQTVALFWAPVIGLILDRVNRVTGIIIAMGLASVGYLGTALLTTPIGGSALLIFSVLGIGQVSALITSQALIGQEAPAAERGAVVGVFSFFGAIGILFASSVGGRLFDAWAPFAPFVIMGIANLVLLIAAIAVRLKAPGLMLKTGEHATA
jgi:MFS family permease